MNSYWIESVPTIPSSSGCIDKDLNCDVCIIGGGITGLNCAYLLTQIGYRVIVLEKDSLASKTTGNTTGKITSQHSLFYDYLLHSFSYDTACLYLKANEEAIAGIEAIIKNENISCEFEYQDSYVFTQSEDKLPNIKAEIEAMHTLGFPAEYLENIPLPLPILGAIKFPKQAQFHPRKYLLGLCQSLLKKGTLIYENSKVIDVKKNSNDYSTIVNDHTIHSNYVILTSRYPFINAPGFYFLKMYQELSHIIAFETKQKLFSGMYLNSESPTLSFRTVPYKDKRIVLLAGFEHKVGAKIDLTNSYSYLENKAKEIYPDANILYQWETQDCISVDKIPYIGEFSSFMPNMYVATGFKKWGMSSSYIAADIICNHIQGNKTPYDSVFASTRFHPIKNNKEVSQMAKEVTFSFAINKLKIPEETLADISSGEGKIIEQDGKKIGVFRDSQNQLHAIKPVCTHLGCELSWNNHANTWDCPCHGSRFDIDGNLLYGPSIRNLEKIFLD